MKIRGASARVVKDALAVSQANTKKCQLDLITASLVWVSSLDRSPLGAFACDRELLALTHALQTLSVQELESSAPVTAGNGSLISAWWYDRAADIISAGWRSSLSGSTKKGHLLTETRSELYLWWTLESSHLEYIESSSVKQMLEDQSFLMDVYTHPFRLPYYEVGLRDAVYIERCLAEGIDAAMAASLGADV